MGVFCEKTKTLYFTCGNAEEIRQSKKFLPEGSSDTLIVDMLFSGTEVTASGNLPHWKNYNISTIVIESSFASVRPTSCKNWFNIPTLTDIQGIENLNTSEVTNMSYMFSACGISTLDLSNFNTEKVTNMNNMFVSCTALTTLDLSSFDTRKVTDMSFMFARCSNLVSIIIGDGWDTSSVTSSNYMFNQCFSIVGYDGTTICQPEWDKTRAHAGTGGYMCKYNPFAVYCTDNNTLFFTYYHRPINSGDTFIPYGSTTTITVSNVWS